MIYKIGVYYTGYTYHEIEAESEDEAMEKAREIDNNRTSDEFNARISEQFEYSDTMILADGPFSYTSEKP